MYENAINIPHYMYRVRPINGDREMYRETAILKHYRLLIDVSTAHIDFATISYNYISVQNSKSFFVC